MNKKFVKQARLTKALVKYLFLMKAVWIIVTATCLQVSAGVSETYSKSVKMNINLQNTDLEQVIWTMKKQSEFNFFYSNDEVQSVKVSDIEMSDVTAEEVLDYCLKGTDLTYEIVHKTVIIKKSDVLDANLTLEQAQQQAQQKTISGSVKDAKGNLLPGVSIIVKGTTIGTTTDNDGNFSLRIPTNQLTLLFSFIGYTTQEVKISTQKTIAIVLEESSVN